MFELALTLTILVCAGMMYLANGIDGIKAETKEIVNW